MDINEKILNHGAGCFDELVESAYGGSQRQLARS